jgi:tryptophan synthase alpha chain
LTAGDPDPATTRDIALAAVDNGADAIELGCRSAIAADGPVIQRASERAVERITAGGVLELAKELHAAKPATGLVLFCAEPRRADGDEEVLRTSRRGGADGVLLWTIVERRSTGGDAQA